jgi:hypothetical protein
MLGISQQGYVVGCRAEWGKPIKTLWRLIPGVALAIAPLFNHLRKQKSSRDSRDQINLRSSLPCVLKSMRRVSDWAFLWLTTFFWVPFVSVQLQPGLRNCSHRKRRQKRRMISPTDAKFMKSSCRTAYVYEAIPSFTTTGQTGASSAENTSLA